MIAQEKKSKSNTLKSRSLRTVSNLGSITTGHPKRDSRSKTLQSYVECIHAWHDTHFMGKFVFNPKSLLRHFKLQFYQFDKTLLPKVFKGMLADYFSIVNKQERPDVPLSGENLFPRRYTDKLYRHIKGKEHVCVTIFWDLMHSKSIAAEVPKSFTKETLLKHRETVSRIKTTSNEVLVEFQEFCRETLSEVAKQQIKGFIPNTHASYEVPRSRRGVRQSWKIENLKGYQPTDPRLIPTSLTISGSAGSGKSLFQSLLVRRFAKYLEKDTCQVAYSRNPQVKHWDGYINQPLVLLDDFLQKASKKAEDSTEHTEFITMNSSVDLVLPMANIREKGRKFNSPLVILSTNKDPTQCVNSLLMTQSDRKAVERRFDLFILKKREEYLLCTVKFDADWIHGYSPEKIFSRSNTLIGLVEPTFELLCKEWSRKSVFHLSQLTERQVLPIGIDQYLECDSSIEDHNRVKVSPILEPLKVRTITIGTTRNHYLKGLQINLLNSLRKYPCFKPCFTPEYDKEIQLMSQRPGIFLSGDYSSATDGLHSDLFQAGISVLVEELKKNDHPDWLIELVNRESRPHICEYPMDIPDVLQTNGQLMGSLLSFPFLCLANAFTVAKATGKSLSQFQDVLIHGDDLLWRTDLSSIQKWKEFCPTIGLGLSIGKNYVHSDWGSIDSQLFINGQRMSTGKYTCYKGDDENKVWTLLNKGLAKGQVVKRCKEFLRTTPRSIDVDRKFGGLGISGKPNTPLEKAIWSLKMEKKFFSKSKIGEKYLYTAPEMFLGSTDYEVSLDTEKSNSSKFHPLWKQLKKLEDKEFFFTEELPEKVKTIVSSKNPTLELLLENLSRHYLQNPANAEINIET